MKWWKHGMVLVWLMSCGVSLGMVRAQQASEVKLNVRMNVYHQRLPHELDGNHFSCTVQCGQSQTSMLLAATPERRPANQLEEEHTNFWFTCKMLASQTESVTIRISIYYHHGNDKHLIGEKEGTFKIYETLISIDTVGDLAMDVTTKLNEIMNASQTTNAKSAG